MTVIEDFVANIAEPQRSVLLQLRQLILNVVPDAEECIYYGIPCFKVDGNGVAGFDAYKKHNSYFPFSGQVFKAIASEVAGFKTTSGALHFTMDVCLSQDLVRLLIETRLDQISEANAHAK